MPLTGAHLWADRFDGGLEDVFDLQDKVTASVVGAIEPALRGSGNSSLGRAPQLSISAHTTSTYVRCRWGALWYRGLQFKYAGLLRQAIARDPNFGPALAGSGMAHLPTHHGRLGR